MKTRIKERLVRLHHHTAGEGAAQCCSGTIQLERKNRIEASLSSVGSERSGPSFRLQHLSRG